MMMKRPSRVILGTATTLAAATFVGCSSGYSHVYKSDRSSSLFFADLESDGPTHRHGVGDGFGNQMWERDVAVAKAEKFGYSEEFFASAEN